MHTQFSCCLTPPQHRTLNGAKRRKPEKPYISSANSSSEFLQKASNNYIFHSIQSNKISQCPSPNSPSSARTSLSHQPTQRIRSDKSSMHRARTPSSQSTIYDRRKIPRASICLVGGILLLATLATGSARRRTRSCWAGCRGRER